MITSLHMMLIAQLHESSNRSEERLEPHVPSVLLALPIFVFEEVFYNALDSG